MLLVSSIRCRQIIAFDVDHSQMRMRDVLDVLVLLLVGRRVGVFVQVDNGPVLVAVRFVGVFQSVVVGFRVVRLAGVDRVDFFVRVDALQVNFVGTGYDGFGKNF